MQRFSDTLEDIEAQPTVEIDRPSYAGHRLVRKLGVCHGCDLHLGDKPYYEVSRRSLIKTAPASASDYQRLRRRLLEEARLGGALHHPNLAGLFDAVGDIEGTHLIFEHVDGTDLRTASSRLRRRGEALPYELCVFLMTEILRGVEYLHQLSDSSGAPLSLVLRDLIPANVLIATTGQAKLATFALSLIPHGEDDARPNPDAPAYLAPERRSKAHHDSRADVYSAGVLLFELLYGRACYQEHSVEEIVAKVVHAGLPLDQLRAEGTPEPLVEIVARATARWPEERYGSAATMSADLTRWLEANDHHATLSTVAKFFEAQGLFAEDAGAEDAEDAEEADPLQLLLSTQPMSDDATEEALMVTDGTLSCFVVSETLEPTEAEGEAVVVDEMTYPLDAAREPMRIRTRTSILIALAVFVFSVAIGLTALWHWEPERVRISVTRY